MLAIARGGHLKMSALEYEIRIGSDFSGFVGLKNQRVQQMDRAQSSEVTVNAIFILVLRFRCSDSSEPAAKYPTAVLHDLLVRLGEDGGGKYAKDYESNCQRFHDATLDQQIRQVCTGRS